MKVQHLTLVAACTLTMTLGATVARAEIDGHGPDAWRVKDVSAHDVLNARMGPGTSYPVIETFAHNERNMQQITCVPYYNAGHYSAMSQAQRDALPPRWCLMRNQAMSKAGWVAQRYITPEGEVSHEAAARISKTVRSNTTTTRKTTVTSTKSAQDPYATSPDMDLAAVAEDLVREVYERQFQSENSDLPGLFDPAVARNYFTDEIVTWLTSGNVDGHPLYGAQDFDGAISEPQADRDAPMVRGMVSVTVDFTNFGHAQRVTFHIRPDMSKSGTPMRIFSVDHEGWSYP